MYQGSRIVDFVLDEIVLVCMYDKNKKSWVKAVIKGNIGQSVYLVYIPSFNLTIKRHKNQILKYSGHSMEVEEDDNFSDWQIVSPSVVESPLSPPSPTATEAAPPPAAAAAAAPVTHPLSDDTPDTNECARSEPVRGEGQCPAPGPSDEFYDADDDARSSPITPAVQEPPRRGGTMTLRNLPKVNYKH